MASEQNIFYERRVAKNHIKREKPMIINYFLLLIKG